MAFTSEILTIGSQGYGWRVMEDATLYAESVDVYATEDDAEAAAIEAVGVTAWGTPGAADEKTVFTADVEEGVEIVGTFTTDAGAVGAATVADGAVALPRDAAIAVVEHSATPGPLDDGVGMDLFGPTVNAVGGGVVSLRTVDVSSGTDYNTLSLDVDFIEIPVQYLSGGVPDAPLSNHARLFVRESAGGKDQLCIRFATGATQVIAAEP